MCFISSNHCAFLASMPFFAAFPMPIMIAIGVASHKPQGQAITKTQTILIKANCPAWI
jgi:hypothetical protein